MSTLKLEHVYKVYPGQKKKDKDVLAVSDFNLEVKGKEFIVFVGPSGCGKSTTLRMIAGLEDITKGNLYIDGELMNRVEPKYRNIAMVFQNYALYPHMTAYQNMSFGLKNMKVPTPKKDKDGKEIIAIDQRLLRNIKAEERRNQKAIASLEKRKAKKEELEKLLPTLNGKEKEKKENELEKINNRFDEHTLESLITKKQQIEKDYQHYSQTPIPLYRDAHIPKEEIDKRVKEAAKILDIEDLLNRKPKAMSGGQRQRVALGRAIVRTPKLFLLDEPLSNLDAKLRAQMRVEITNLYNKLDVPFIYVTHDQVEAMTMGTRIVVLRKGVIQQVDTPTNLYDHPRNRFVAGFIGTPQMNFYEVTLTKNGENLEIRLPKDNVLSVPLKDLEEIEDSYLDGNPHQAILGIRSEDIALSEKGFELSVFLTETLGSDSLIYADFDPEQNNIQESKTGLVLKDKERSTLKRGDKIHVVFDTKKIHLFSADEKEQSIFKEKEE